MPKLQDVIYAAAMLCGLASSCCGGTASELTSLVNASLARDVVHRVPSETRLRATKSLFRAMVDVNVSDEELRHQAWDLQFDLTVLEESGDRRIRVIHEQPTARFGRGVYAIRLGVPEQIVMQAPHGFFDLRTRELVISMFANSDFYGASWNTTHRSRVDVAHESRHSFQMFTEAVTSVHAVTVVQLHGFSSSSRQSRQARTADIVVSNGSRQPRLSTRRMTHILQQAFPDRNVRLFPTSVDELGATTNVQAASVALHARSDFVSLELNADLRKTFIRNPTSQLELIKALNAVTRHMSKE